MDFTVFEIVLGIALVLVLAGLFIAGKTDKVKRYVLELVIIAEENFPEPKGGKNKYYWVTAELKRVFPLFVTFVGRKRLSEWIEESVSFMKSRLKGGLTESIKNKEKSREELDKEVKE